MLFWLAWNRKKKLHLLRKKEKGPGEISALSGGEYFMNLKLIFLFATLWGAIILFPKQTTVVGQIVHDKIESLKVKQ